MKKSCKTVAFVGVVMFFGVTGILLRANSNKPYSAIETIHEGQGNRGILNKLCLLQIPFVENKGQIEDEGTRYCAKTFGGTVFITEGGQLVYSLPNVEKQEGMKGWVIRESFVGASIAHVKGEEKATTRVSYFKGKNPAKWGRNIPTYKLVSLGEIYEGIELKLQAHGNNVEKLFYVKPGANAERIKAKIEGAKHLNVNERGELEVETGLGVVKFTKPSAYQIHCGERKYIKVAYEVRGNSYSFNVGAYDRTQELIIDPLLGSTFLGGATEDEHLSYYSTAIDPSGNVYVAGFTFSSDFPTTLGAYDEQFNGNHDAFVSKLDSDLQNLLASTYLGGGNGDQANCISIDSGGNVYVAGITASSEFPTTPGAYDTTLSGNWDAFVSELDGNLQNLFASTLFGGGRDEEVYSISQDTSGDIYVAGWTWSSEFPTTPGAYDTTHNGYEDAMVAKFDADLENLLASTFLGGGSFETANSISIDASGNVYVAGSVSSSNFPTTPSSYDPTHNGVDDAFVSKFDADLENLLASTFLGGDGLDQAFSVFIDMSGNVYMAGYTESQEFPTTLNAYDTTLDGDYDAFVSKFDADLENLLASTFLGGSYYDKAYSISIDTSGNVYVAGFTLSSDFPTTPDAYDELFNGEHDAYVSKLDSDLGSLLAATFLGGSDLEAANSISIDASGNVYVAGGTYSSDFPTTPGAYDTTYNGDWDAFISKFDPDLFAVGIEEDEFFQRILFISGVEPNPFRNYTEIRWQIRDNSDMELKIYDIAGRLVKDFHRPSLGMSHQSSVQWDGTDHVNQRLPSGVYFLRLQAGDLSATEKLLLIR